MCDITSCSLTISRREWRKLVKKLRRKKIRQTQAKERELTMEKSGVNSCQESQTETEFCEQELRHLQWLKDEKDAQLAWQQKENIRREQENKKIHAQETIKKEWEAARQKKQEQQKELERKQMELHNKIEDFISGSGKAPAELLAFSETNPGRELCPFFSKVAACRFGQTCSRNHKVPGISRIIVISNFYTHFTLNQSRAAEYDTDVGLEFDEREMLRHFREFFEDVVGELENYGAISVVQVCKNSEPHLRGNVYVEYTEERFALRAARALNARWYGGRQLTVCLANISDWGAAICGDFHRGKCPKGNECNFLHTLRNPGGWYVSRRKEKLSTPRSWRWSESPERVSSSSSSRSERRHSERGSRRSEKHSHSRSRSRADGDRKRRSKKSGLSNEKHNRDISRKENKYGKKKINDTHLNSPNTHLSPHNSS